MYGYQREKNLNEVRTMMLTKMVGNDKTINPKFRVNLSLLPPCVDAHHPHVDCVNHRVALFKRSNIPIYDAQKKHTKDKDGKNTVISLNQFGHMDLFCHPLSLTSWTRHWMRM